MLTPWIFLAALLATSLAKASPMERRQTITALTTDQINAYTPFTHFVSTAYCDPSLTSTWTCGANCEANSDFIPVASGGDGATVQSWYVGYSPSQASVIVAHQGTNFDKVAAIATDLDIVLGSLDPSLFQGIPSSVEVHTGFANEHAKTATQILSAVQTAIAQHSATQVTTVGHSLGAAIALLDGIYLPLYISGVTFRTIGYGTPRVGNQDFANYVDSHLPFTHINNKKDIVPILPGEFLGYRHPSGEIHIDENDQWLSCPGQDNPSDQCIVGDLPMIFFGDIDDHSGPYNGITMGC